MRKVIGLILAGWPFAVLGTLALMFMYREFGLVGTAMMIGAWIVTLVSVWVGMNLALGTKGEGR